MHRNQIYSSEFVKEYDRMAFGGYYDYDSIAKDLAGILKDKREILELGIGTGNVAIILAKCGFSVHGIDYSDEMLEILKDKLKNTGLNMVLQKAGSTNFKFPVKFDGVFSPFRLLLFKNINKICRGRDLNTSLPVKNRGFLLVVNKHTITTYIG